MRGGRLPTRAHVHAPARHADSHSLVADRSFGHDVPGAKGRGKEMKRQMKSELCDAQHQDGHVEAVAPAVEEDDAQRGEEGVSERQRVHVRQLTSCHDVARDAQQHAGGSPQESAPDSPQPASRPTHRHDHSSMRPLRRSRRKKCRVDLLEPARLPAGRSALASLPARGTLSLSRPVRMSACHGGKRSPPRGCRRRGTLPAVYRGAARSTRRPRHPPRNISSPVRRLWRYEVCGAGSRRLAGSLIQAVWGIAGGRGRRPKRSG